MFTCPVLAFTPFVEEALAWCDLTHTVDAGQGWIRWRRTTLPSAGGIAQQPSKLLAAITFVVEQRNVVLAALLKKQQTPGARDV